MLIRVSQVSLLSALVLGWALSPVAAQDAQSPYAGQELRQIKALSEEQIDGLLAGKGLGFAKAAELNRHPGPRHVLDLREQLALRPEQAQRVEAVFAAMQAEASRLGREIVARETELDGLFSRGEITRDALRRLTGEIGRLTGALRGVHLAAHLDMVEVLTPHQTMLYDRLRGYTGGGPGGQQGHGAGGQHMH